MSQPKAKRTARVLDKIKFDFPEPLKPPNKVVLEDSPAFTFSTGTLLQHSRFHDARQGRIVHRQHTVSVFCELFERKYRIVGASDDIVVL